MKKSDNIKDVMKKLDAWVSVNGSGRYIPENFKSSVADKYTLPENFGIQQVRKEIKEFTRVLLNMPKRKIVLEIGLGYFGSTHFLWRAMFDKAATIEYQKERILSFGESMRKFYGRWMLDDGKSVFFFGKSNEAETLKKVYDFFEGGIDLLFIDGDHRYEGVMADWLLYHNLVRDGGIVAFHDAVAKVDHGGVPRFLKKLDQGGLDGRKYPLQKIIHSKDAGIAFYKKKKN